MIPQFRQFGLGFKITQELLDDDLAKGMIRCSILELDFHRSDRIAIEVVVAGIYK